MYIYWGMMISEPEKIVMHTKKEENPLIWIIACVRLMIAVREEKIQSFWWKMKSRILWIDLIYKGIVFHKKKVESLVWFHKKSSTWLFGSRAKPKQINLSPSALFASKSHLNFLYRNSRWRMIALVFIYAGPSEFKCYNPVWNAPRAKSA